MIETRKREHSRKPDEQYELIEACSPGPYLELFARPSPTRLACMGRRGTMTMRLCVVCGEPSEQSRCDEHQLDDQRLDYRARGYDTRWSRLSEQARRLQPFCTDCGSTVNLTADHLPIAWRRKAQRKPLRLKDIDVVCNDCNVRRGSSRPGTTRGEDPERANSFRPPMPSFSVN